MNPYQPLSTLPSLYASKMASNPYGLSLPSSSTTQSSGLTQGGKTLATSSPVGVQTKSPTDTITAPPNITTQPKVTNPLSTSSTANGTAGSSPMTVNLPGSGTTKAPDDPTNKYNTSTGQLNPNYKDPNAPIITPASSTSSSAYTPTNSGLYGQLVSDLANKSQQSGADYKAAQDEANRIAQKQTDLSNEFAKKDMNIQGTAGFLTQATGLEGQLQKQYDIGQGALASQYAGATNRLGAANTQQGLLQQALSQAAGYSQPTSQFGVLTNPITGQPINGQSATQAAIQGGTIQGLQSGASTAASTGGTIQSQQQTQVAGYQSALQQGQNLQRQLSNLITTFNLNPNDLNAANVGLQKIAQNTSDPHYQQLLNYINDVANTYAQVLTPPGGSATDTTRGIASSMLNATASGASILDTMKSLDNAAQAKIAGVPTTDSGSTGGSSFSGAAWKN